MSEIKARYVGPNDAVYVVVPVSTEGEPPRQIIVKNGEELPTEIDGHKVPASFRDSLLEQEDNWSSGKKTKTAADADKKEA